jgi:nitrate reductase NapE component
LEDKLHKNKKRKVIEEKAEWRKQIFLSLGIIVFGTIAILLVGAWVKSLPIMQAHYAKPGELSMDNGIWVLIVYGILLISSVIGGYFVQKRIEEN